jgi:PPOX class probable F420-dependent enzyme
MLATIVNDLAKAPFIDLITFRKDGRGVHTTVLAAPRDGALLIRTHHTAGKLKRLRQNGSVEIVPLDSRGRPTGQAQPGTARILPPDESARCLRLLHRRHPVAGLLGTWFRHVRGMRDVFIQVTPD